MSSFRYGRCTLAWAIVFVHKDNPRRPLARRLLVHPAKGGHNNTDLVPSYNVPLPMKVIARMLGIPSEDYSFPKSFVANKPASALRQAQGERIGCWNR